MNVRKAAEKVELREEKKSLARWDRNMKRLKKIGAVVMIVVGTLGIAGAGMAQQMSVGIGAGMSTEGKAVAELTAQCDFGPAFIQAGYLAHLTRQVSAGTFINVQAGHHFQSGDYFFEPSAGWAFIGRSADRPELNSQAMIYSLKAGKDINQGSLYLGANYSERVFIGILGIRYNF